MERRLKREINMDKLMDLIAWIVIELKTYKDLDENSKYFKFLKPKSKEFNPSTESVISSTALLIVIIGLLVLAFAV